MRCFSCALAWGLSSCIVPLDTNAADPDDKPRATTPDARDQAGNASFYGRRFDGRRTASGDVYDPAALTAAHRTLPIGTRVRVVNPKNDRSVVVTVNDRGPMSRHRIIDLSSAAADRLDMKKAGVARVRTEVLAPSDVSKTDRPVDLRPR